MPLPTPKANESKADFSSRCMGDDFMVSEYKDEKQRLAVCLAQFDRAKSKNSQTPDMEVRHLKRGQADLRVENGTAKPKIVGYAAVYNSLSENLGGFRERIINGAFSRALKEGQDVRALVEHDPARLLGRSKSGTLTMRSDDHGLRVEIDPANTQAGRDAIESLRRGDLDSMSFSFKATLGGDRWGEENGVNIRELLDVNLFDVSVVAWPAYLSTEAALRSLELWKKDRRGVVPFAGGKTVDPGEWDGDAAEGRVRAWATSGEGDQAKVDFEKYQRAFTWFDSANAENVTAYKLLHHDIQDGDLVVHRRGVIAAMTAVLGGRGGVDVPAEDLESTYNHLAKHYKEYEMEPPAFHRSAWQPSLDHRRRRLQLAE